MFQSISWQAYFVAMGFLLVVYYAIVAFVYYRHDLLLKINSPRSFGEPNQIPGERQSGHRYHQPKAAGVNEEIDIHPYTEADDSSALVNSLTDEIKALTSAAGTRYSKSELATALQKLLKRYFILKDSIFFQTTINQIIASECKLNCSIELSEKETVELWNG